MAAQCGRRPEAAALCGAASFTRRDAGAPGDDAGRQCKALSRLAIVGEPFDGRRGGRPFGRCPTPAPTSVRREPCPAPRAAIVSIATIGATASAAQRRYALFISGCRVRLHKNAGKTRILGTARLFRFNGNLRPIVGGA